MTHTERLAELRQNLVEYYSDEELRTLCFDLGVDYDNLPGRAKADKARELLSDLDRHDRIPDLIQLGEAQRPKLTWRQVPTDVQAEPPHQAPPYWGEAGAAGALRLFRRPVALAAAAGLTLVIVAVVLFRSSTGIWGPVPTPSQVALGAPSATPSAMPTATATPTPQPTSTTPFTGTRSAMDVRPPVEGALIEYATAEPVPQKTLVPSSALKITSFTLDSEASSYEKVKMPFAAAYPPPVTTYQSSFERLDQIRRGGCLPQAELDLPRIKEALQHFARQHGRDDVLSYIATEAQVQTFARDWPAVARRLVPRSAEWLELSMADREAYTTWLLNCVGIPYPAFHVTVQNTSDQEQVITSIVYRVRKTGQVMGGEGGALSPQVTFVHSIAWQTGDQEVTLEHPFSISPKRSASLNLQLMPSTGDIGMCWLMTIYFVIDGGPDAVASDEFQLIMSNMDSNK